MNDITNITTGSDTETNLAPVPTFDGKAYAVSVFEPFKRQIAKAKREAGKAETYDITTGAGMGRAKELRAMFRDIRTTVENIRKDRKAPIIEAGKLLDARAAEIKAEVEPFEDKYDREIKAEEQRKEDEKQRKLAEERARVEAIENRIANIRGAASRLAGAGSDAIQAELNTWTLLRLEPGDYQEYLEDALTAVNTTVDQLSVLLSSALLREENERRAAAEREELLRLRREQEAREKAEREAAAERERLARIERDKAEADRRAAAEREAELQRQLADMKAVMEALQRPAAPPAAPVAEVPLIEEGAPTVLGVDLAAPDGDETAEWIADLPSMDELVPDTIKAASMRPDAGKILDVLMTTFNADEKTVMGWLTEMVMEQGL